MATAAARKAISTNISTTLTTGIKRHVVERTAQVIHATFPQVSVAQQASRKYFAIFATTVSVAGFMALLGINTLLAQDAFTLSNLKVEAKGYPHYRCSLCGASASCCCICSRHEAVRDTTLSQPCN